MREARSLNEQARDLEARIAELVAERDGLPRSERKPLNRQIHLLRGILGWIRTRRGYEPSPRDLALL